jgi:hypothetical protein
MRPSGRFPRQYSVLLAVSKVTLRESSPLLWRVIAEITDKLKSDMFVLATIGVFPKTIENVATTFWPL